MWTPRLDGARPVLVWLPGGAYLSGATAQPVYDAARLADEGDLVVVTVGYRLGALGFLAPEGDGVANCGLRDQLAALAWVREHAGEFGGDPRRVTVMGESAGAGSVLHLLTSPARGDAFDRAIAQSGQPITLDRATAAEVAHTFAAALGVESASADELRTLPVEQLLDAQETTLGDDAREGRPDGVRAVDRRRDRRRHRARGRRRRACEAMSTSCWARPATSWRCSPTREPRRSTTSGCCDGSRALGPVVEPPRCSRGIASSSGRR